MAKRGTREERALDAALQQAMNGRTIAVLDISKAYAAARTAMAAGVPIDAAARIGIDAYAVPS